MCTTVETTASTCAPFKMVSACVYKNWWVPSARAPVIHSRRSTRVRILTHRERPECWWLNQYTQEKQSCMISDTRLSAEINHGTYMWRVSLVSQASDPKGQKVWWRLPAHHSMQKTMLIQSMTYLTAKPHQILMTMILITKNRTNI